MLNFFHLTKGNVAFLKTLVALERTGRGLALVALKRTGCDVSQVECQAGNITANVTRRPASAERTVRRQFQATGQPVSQTQASDAMTSRLPRYEAKCVQCRCFQWVSVPLRSDIKGTGATPCQYIDTTRKAIDCATTLLLTLFI